MSNHRRGSIVVVVACNGELLRIVPPKISLLPKCRRHMAQMTQGQLPRPPHARHELSPGNMHRPAQHHESSGSSGESNDEWPQPMSSLRGATAQQLINIRVTSAGGTQLYQHSQPRSDRVHWAYIMSHILTQAQGPAPCSIALYEHSVSQCFAAGSSFSSLFWVDELAWFSLVSRDSVATLNSQPTEGQQFRTNTVVVEVTAVFSPNITLNTLVYGGYAIGHWTIAEIADAGINGSSFLLVHSTTHMQLIRRSRALSTWPWRNHVGLEFGHAVCLDLTRLMPRSEGRTCEVCARMLHPMRSPDRYRSVRLVAFPASSVDCQCSVLGRSLTIHSLPFSQFQ